MRAPRSPALRGRRWCHGGPVGTRVRRKTESKGIEERERENNESTERRRRVRVSGKGGGDPEEREDGTEARKGWRGNEKIERVRSLKWC